MDVSTRYGRWLAMMFLLMGLYMLVQFVWDGYYAGLLFASWLVISMSHKLYKAGVGSWRQVTIDFGGGIVTLSIFALIVWGYFSISM
ncbi:MAG: hypothetical protein JOZ51_04505 [Chloroflexi bacterium]|nr:hypothetical protein [Chloroflexota bacterium]